MSLYEIFPLQSVDYRVYCAWAWEDTVSFANVFDYVISSYMGVVLDVFEDYYVHEFVNDASVYRIC